MPKTIKLDAGLESLISQGVPDPTLGQKDNRLLKLLQTLVATVNELTKKEAEKPATP